MENLESLRERLALDLLSTRRRGSAALSAVDVFEEWKTNEKATFEGEPRDDAALSILAGIETLVGELRRRLPGLPAFEEQQLRDLDRLSLDLHERCRSFWNRTVSSSNSAGGEA